MKKYNAAAQNKTANMMYINGLSKIFSLWHNCKETIIMLQQLSNHKKYGLMI